MYPGKSYGRQGRVANGAQSKGRIRWLPKMDIAGQAKFIEPTTDRRDERFGEPSKFAFDNSPYRT
jgi:hypothetical protein